MEGYDIFLEALKWIALVFLAGFVGYFGKYLGIKIIARFQKDKDIQAGGTDKVHTTAPVGQSGEKHPAAGQTMEPAASVTEESLIDIAREENDRLRKKQEKDRLKQIKKESKEKIKQQKKES